jgi:predicted DNA-binding transcriptional regulator YafY
LGQRSAAETIASILLAFVEHGTWRQAELASRVGVSVPALRKRLRELQDAGMSLEREDDPPQVFWSVPRGWFPGGVVVAGKELEDLLRLAVRAPRSEGQRRVLRLLASSGLRTAAGEAVEAAALSCEDERVLGVLEEGASRAVVVRIRYQSRSDGVPRWRHVSAQRVVMGQPVRFVGFCHKAGALRWFRVDHVRAAELDEREGWLGVSPDRLEAYLKESVGGFHGGGEAREVSFVVRDPEARWVAENLPSGWAGELVERGLRVRVTTSSVEQVARYVVGLGAAAVSETEELGEEVKRLALGALRGSGARGDLRSVGAKGSSGWGVGVG